MARWESKGMDGNQHGGIQQPMHGVGNHVRDASFLPMTCIEIRFSSAAKLRCGMALVWLPVVGKLLMQNHIWRLRGAYAVFFKRILAAVPLPGVLVSSMVAPAFSTIALQIARPSPAPPVERVREGSPR